jgi:hypothetical protein
MSEHALGGADEVGALGLLRGDALDDGGPAAGSRALEAEEAEDASEEALDGDRPAVGAAGGRAAGPDHHGDAAVSGDQFFQRQAVGIGEEGCASHSDLRGSERRQQGWLYSHTCLARARPTLTKRSSDRLSYHSQP